MTDSKAATWKWHIP